MDPQQFSLSVYETYSTKDPNGPLTGAEIEGSIDVTVQWAAAAASQPTLAFAAPSWIGCGAGPLAVYDDEIGGLKPIGTVKWAVETHSIFKTEPNTPEKKARWTVTPVVQLVRTFTPSDGSPPDTQVTYTASDTAKGDWFPLASA